MDSDRVIGTAKKVGGKVEDLAGDVTGDTKLNVDGVIDQAKGAAQTAYGQAKDAVRDYADQAQDIAGDAYEQGKRYVDEGRKRLPEAAERYVQDGRELVSHHVGESPLAALLIAGAVGYLAALVIHGKR